MSANEAAVCIQLFDEKTVKLLQENKMAETASPHSKFDSM
jgi:hypothetical protein